MYPIFPFANLEHAELLATSAEHHQSFHLVVDLVGVIVRPTFLPVWSQGCDELLPVYQSFAMAVEQVRDCSHFQPRRLEFYEDK